MGSRLPSAPRESRRHRELERQLGWAPGGRGCAGIFLVTAGHHPQGLLAVTVALSLLWVQFLLRLIHKELSCPGSATGNQAL